MVFDTHREDSIKNTARSNRVCTTGIQFRNMAPGLQIQQWSTANKANLIKFLVAECKTPKVREKPNDKQLYVASEETRLLITNDLLVEVAGMSSNQEEANTRIIWHAAAE